MLKVLLGYLLMVGGGIGGVISAMSGIAGRQAPLGELLLSLALAFASLLFGGLLLSGLPMNLGKASAIAVSRASGPQAVAAIGCLFVTSVIALISLLSLVVKAGDSSAQPIASLVFAAVVALPAVLFLRGARRTTDAVDQQIRLATLRQGARCIAESSDGALASIVASTSLSALERLREMYKAGILPIDPREADLACIACGSEGELRETTLQKYTGLVVFTETTVVRGLHCGPCIVRIASEFNDHNRLAGWGSISGSIGTLIALPQNFAESRAASEMTAPESPGKLDGAVLGQLKPFADGMIQQLVGGANPKDVFRGFAIRAGVTPGQACRFAATLAGFE